MRTEHAVDIEHRDTGTKGAFLVESNGRQLAEMTYVWVGKERIIIDHTEVSDELRGQGVGKQLVAAAVDFARERSISILPLCPFAKSVFGQVPEFRDVL
jgi:uncharacterized protein